MDRIDRLQAHVEALEQQMKVMGVHTRTVERRLRWWRVIACGVVLLSMLGLALPSGNAEEVSLTPTVGGRYLPGLFDQTGFLISVGQGQVGWFAFDLGRLAGVRVRAMTFSFTQVGTTNPTFFPLTINIYDVTTPFDRLIVDRIPIDAEGEQIAEDLHTGKVYASFVVTADGEGTRYNIALNNAAIGDLQAAIDRGDQFFSIGLANDNFYAGGYFTPGNATLSVIVAFGNRCPLGQGFWKNHTGAWPVTSLTLGSQTYTQAALLALFDTPPRGDASVILAHQLIAVKLNIANGADPTPISATIADADHLLSGFTGKLPYHVRPSSATGQAMVSDTTVLERYNNGALTPNCTP